MVLEVVALVIPSYCQISFIKRLKGMSVIFKKGEVYLELHE